MEHPQDFLLKKIAGYATNGHQKLAHLNAEFVEDISDLLEEYATLTVFEVIELAKKKQGFRIGSEVFSLRVVKK